MQVIWVPGWDRLPHFILDYVRASFQLEYAVGPGFLLGATEAMLCDKDQIRFWRLYLHSKDTRWVWGYVLGYLLPAF